MVKPLTPTTLRLLVAFTLFLGVARAGTQNPFDDDDDNSGGGGGNTGGGGSQNPFDDDTNTGGGGGNTGGGNTGGGNTGGGNTGNQAAYACPGDNGKLYTTGDVTFQLKCGQGTSARHLGTVPSATLKDCADICARNPSCQSCDWSPSQCNLKGEYIPTFSAPYDTWFPTEAREVNACPAQKIANVPENPETTKKASCPSGDGKVYEAGDGNYYLLQCCVHEPAGNVVETTTAGSYAGCIEKCAENTACKSILYTIEDADANDKVGKCKLFDAAGFSTKSCGGKMHHHAFITDPPVIESPDAASVLCSTECPFANGQQYTSRFGEVFHMDCGMRHGTKYIHSDTQSSLKNCMDACAALVPCHSVDYNRRTRTCYYSNHHGEPTIQASGFDSAHSMGCAGACTGGGCGCGGGGRNDDSPAPKPEPETPPQETFCPGNNGKIINRGGIDFRVTCGSSVRSNDGKKVNAGNEDECMTMCASDPTCHGANYYGQQGCFHHPSSQTGILPESVAGGVIALSPIPRVEPYCPRMDQQVITKNGIDFKVLCNQAVTSSGPWQKPASGPDECAANCAADANCYGVNWDVNGKICHLHAKQHNQPVTYNAWITFRPLNKA